MLLFDNIVHGGFAGLVMAYVFIGVSVIAAIFLLSRNAAADTPNVVADCGGSQQVKRYYNYSELVFLASQAGFSEDSSVAAAVALAESGGDSQILGDLNLAPSNGPAVGLWQINSAKHKEFTQDQLLDAQTNANEAFTIYSRAGYDFTDWTTYNSGKYQLFLQ